MKTSNGKTSTGWPDIAGRNTRIDDRADQPTDLPLRVLLANWLCAVFGK